MSKQKMINVRIPEVVFNDLKRAVNQIPITDEDGVTTRVDEPFGLVDSNTAMVNTILLALLLSVIPESRVSLLTRVTPGVNMTYVSEARKRLVPNKTMNVPVNNISNMLDKQDEQFEQLANGLQKMYVSQQYSANQMIEDQGSLLQLLAYWVGANSQANVSDSATYNDSSASAVRKAIDVYGDQHLTDFRMKSRSDSSQGD